MMGGSSILSQRKAWHGLLVLAAGLLVWKPSPTRATSFRTEILPILTKAGCNSGACHGAATGQGGFRLSLLGYDPEEDFERITRELGGRRIDLDDPERSLFLKKPTGRMDHEGGRRIPRDSEWYSNLIAWIKSGAPYGPPDLRVDRIAVEPQEALTDRGQSIALRVTATLSDGSTQAATPLALYTSSDDAVATVGKDGKVTTVGSGLASIMIRYGGQVAASRVVVPFGNSSNSQYFAPNNFIDESVLKELRRLGLPASPLSNDAEFLRRASLDVAGRLPTVAETRSFLDSNHPGKRGALLDRLLNSESFIDLWTTRLSDLLLINGKRGGEKAAKVYQDWLRSQIAANTSLDQVAFSLLTASGNLLSNGPANFYTLATDPRDLSEHVSRIFLGTQIACARCHAHPADRWTQEDYYGFAANFAGIGQAGDLIKVNARSEVTHPKTGARLRPKPLGANYAHSPTGADPRLELANWIINPENPLFAHSMVNRVWKHLLGRGLVEPVDDMRPTNPATHPELLNALARGFVENHYDLRWLVRRIASSGAYQLSSKAPDANRVDTSFYSHAYRKELSAQVFMDAVATVTGVPEAYEGYPPGASALQLIGAQTPSYSLDVLGRCPREMNCDTPSKAGGGLAQALHLINGATINAKLAGGVVDQLLARHLSDQEMVDQLYLRALCRSPNPAESAEWRSMLSAAPNKAEAAQDLLWALLNSREFAFNH